MTPKSDAAAAERKVMERYEARLERAFAEYTGEPRLGKLMVGKRATGTPIDDGYCARILARTQLRILRASAAALFPGDQQRKHLLPALGKMVTASCRVIRKSGK